MSGIVDQQTRSRMMSVIRGKDAKPELALRRALHAHGFRFRLLSTKVQGRPDLVLPKYRSVVFVLSCFWQRREGCRYATTPVTRAEFWQTKFAANVARDNAVPGALLTAGWRVATIWECALRKPEQVSVAADRLSEWLLTETDTLVLANTTFRNPQVKARTPTLLAYCSSATML
jgi:DNA mismatch endonuclease, patch repair protein